jgi:hypothetical protein
MGGNVGDVGTSIAASKNAVENNFLALAYPAIPAVVYIVEAAGACFVTGPCTAITLGILTAVGYEVIDQHINNNQTNKVQEDSSSADDIKIIFIPDDMPKLEGYPIPEPTPPFPGYTPIDPDKLGPNHTGHDGGLDDIDIRHDTGGNQIPDKDWRDNILASERFIIDGKIKEQMGPRGWTEEDIKDAISKGPVGTSNDSRSGGKTSDGKPRNDTATVYGEKKGGYVIINDRTGEVVQIGDKNDSNWVDDSRIKWNN